MNHLLSKSLLTVGLTKRKQLINYGVIKIQKGKIIGFLEKPINKYFVSMGVYVLNKNILKSIA